jgi:hypothetical protein
MGNSVVDEVEPKLIDIIEKKNKELAKLIENEDVTLEWGDPDIYDIMEDLFVFVSIRDCMTNEEIGFITFTCKVFWEKHDASFIDWTDIRIIQPSVRINLYSIGE